MALKLTVGLSKKVGRPDYGSLGATCGLELEIPEGFLHPDLDAFRHRVRDAFLACDRAVDDELARHRAHAAPADDLGGRDGSPTENGAPAPEDTASPGRPRRPATPSQVRAIVAIARRQHAELEGLLRDEYGAARPEDLSLAQASRLIDQLKAAGEI